MINMKIKNKNDHKSDLGVGCNFWIFSKISLIHMTNQVREKMKQRNYMNQTNKQIVIPVSYRRINKNNLLIEKKYEEKL